MAEAIKCARCSRVFNCNEEVVFLYQLNVSVLSAARARRAPTEPMREMIFDSGEPLCGECAKITLDAALENSLMLPRLCA